MNQNRLPKFLFAISICIGTVLSGAALGAASGGAEIATAPGLVDTGRASLSVSTDATGYESATIVETRYLKASYPSRSYLKAIITERRWEGAESSEGSVSLSKLVDGTSRLNKVAWSKVVPGTTVEILEDTFVGVSQSGCCDSPTITRLLNFESGAPIETVNSKILFFEAPRFRAARTRGLATSVDETAPPSFEGKRYVGTVSYFSENMVIARAQIYASLKEKSPVLYDLKPVGLRGERSRMDIREDRTVLWDTEDETNPEKAFDSFGITLTFSGDEDQKVKIAITNDTIDKASSGGITATGKPTAVAIRIIR